MTGKITTEKPRTFNDYDLSDIPEHQPSEHSLQVIMAYASAMRHVWHNQGTDYTVCLN